MSPFEFFFSFYGLLLGFSVAELVGGFARIVHARKALAFGILTPMLAAFVALDMVTFWNQAWQIFRNAPFNMFLLAMGLIVAGIFYLSATLVFPRGPAEGARLDDHFWKHRRLVMLGVLTANWIIAGLFFANAFLTGEMTQLNLQPVFWFGLALFTAVSLMAGLAKGKGIVAASLAVLLLYQGYNIVRSGVELVRSGGWIMLQEPAPPG